MTVLHWPICVMSIKFNEGYSMLSTKCNWARKNVFDLVNTLIKIICSHNIDKQIHCNWMCMEVPTHWNRGLKITIYMEVFWQYRARWIREKTMGMWLKNTLKPGSCTMFFMWMGYEWCHRAVFAENVSQKMFRRNSARDNWWEWFVDVKIHIALAYFAYFA